MSLNRKKFTTTVAGERLEFEVSRLAEQADAAVIGRYGDTEVLVTVVMGHEDKDIDYLPLVVDYEEKYYAVGKILGSRYMRREGKSTDEAVLSGRLIDRTIRPLFDHGIRREIQIIVTILAFDGEHDPDFVTLMTASVALHISRIPWNGPVAGIHLGQFNGEVVINPPLSRLSQGNDFDTFAAGPRGRINMIELEGSEAQEDDIMKAFMLAQKEINALIDFQETIRAEIGKEKATLNLFKPSEEITQKVLDFLGNQLEKALFIPDKTESYAQQNILHESLMTSLRKEGLSPQDMAQANHVFEHEADLIVHRKAINDGVRLDGRRFDQIRELYAEVGLIKRAHGTGLFVRGMTQALAVTTIAPPSQEQLFETMEFNGGKRFMLHYNFPPYSVGETGKMRGPGRREIGHGALAEKALKRMIPSKDIFPYAIRVVSEILSSNGSSSMATVCAASLSLMDAGVPLARPLAGIAMGLMKNDKDEYRVLTDIQGAEDHHGDMDFKVAGTKGGVSAIQLDVKINGLTEAMIRDTLHDARAARLTILDIMNATLPQSRTELSIYAPRVLTLKIDPDMIGALIGPGGKTINTLVKSTGVTGIDVEQDGSVYIFSEKKEAAEAALAQVEVLTKTYKVGDIVEGTIVKVLDFGAILEFAPGRDGMIHVSELKEGFVKNVIDVVKVGDFVRAKIKKIDGDKISLTIKGL